MKTLLIASLLFAVAPARALLPEEENTIKVFREASPAVVFVTNVALGQNMFMEEFAIPQGAGSGFLWDAEGHVVTNFHVVQNGEAFLVTLADRTQLEAKVVGVDPAHDIAVLKIEKGARTLTPLPVGSSEKLQVGQQAIAIGAPFGLDHSLTKGIVSALGREVQGIGGVTIRDMIQTDASINPGNSGGALLDSSGNLIGMNTMIFSRSGSSAGVGFAVPVSVIKRIVPQLVKHGRVIRPGMGVSLLPDGRKYYLVGDVQGAVIDRVNPDGPAAKAGLRGGRILAGRRYAVGDIIVAIDDLVVNNFDDLFNALDRHKVGDTVKVKYLRDGKAQSASIALVGIE